MLVLGIDPGTIKMGYGLVGIGPPIRAEGSGVIGLPRSLAIELGKYSINVNCICPGFIKTAIFKRVRKKDPNRFKKIHWIGSETQIVYLIELLFKHKFIDVKHLARRH